MENNQENLDSLNVCQTPSIKSVEFDKTDVKNKIDKLNMITENENSENIISNDDAVNINDILMENVKDKVIKSFKENTVGNSDETQTSKLSEFEVINQDPYLKPYETRIKERIIAFRNLLKEIDKNEGSFIQFSRSHKNMGLHICEDGITFKEYAPGALEMTIFGDFNNWNRSQYHCTKDEFGFWKILIPKDENGELPIKHNSKIKINLKFSNNKYEDRNPAYITYLIQNNENLLFDSVFWNPDKPYVFKHPSPPKPKSLRIYEAHVGMSSIEPKVSTYREFADTILPRIKRTGYTAIQLMAIMEHVYYGCFGYHVTNYFAISSRCGTPDDLKYLIDKSHEMGLYVIMDLIHSHASSNVLDGINYFDGTDYLYFHGGERGFHKLWDSRVFNYKNWETLRFLLSNCVWYLEEYKFDGFRFDGVTSILYENHGINYSFSGGYNEYFNDNFDFNGGVYLMLANYLIHLINPDAISIAEDVSGMPTLCRPIEDGGFGFDYRLNMSVPDKWIQLIKEFKDEQWNMGNICYTLTNRRFNEKHIAYVESHDQCIVGDKTISQWLFDKEIYENMSLQKPLTIVVDRGMALHKMIRLITYSLGGEGYLNFMGNEFGHPEWVDFPRVGNNFSHHYSRRRWDLCDNKTLRYQYLYKFDIWMHKLETDVGWLTTKHQYITLMHEKDKLIVFEKGDLLFIFNFHSFNSFENYRIGTKWSSEHLILLDSDDCEFGGKDRLKYGHQHFFPIMKDSWMNRPNYIQLYIPSRTAMILIAKENMNKYNLAEYIELNNLINN